MENNPPQPAASKKPLYIFLAILFLAIYTAAAIVGYQYLFKKQALSVPQWKGDSTVAGQIDLNGIPPTGATIAIFAKASNESAYTEVASAIDATDETAWSWHGAQADTAYSFQAKLIANDTQIASSKKTEIIAPAQNQFLRINVPSEEALTATEMALSPTSSSNQLPSVLTTSLSGTFDINGYIPPNSTVTILARKAGLPNFATIVQNVPAIDDGVWVWSGATVDATYDVEAVLNTTSNIVVQSSIIQVTAPAENEVLVINSTLTPPVPARTSLSGTMNISGVIPANSTISLGVRQTGQSQFNTIASGIAAVNNAVWSYNQAQSGVSYDVQATLISNGNTISQSQILTVDAPATGEILNIGITNQPSAPAGGTITNSCVSPNGANPAQWQVSFNFNNNGAVSNAQQFQFQVGTSTGGNQMVSITTTPSNPNQSQNYTSGFTFTQGQTYYAQYSYATCQNCNTFSSWSPPLQFYCNPAAPTQTPTPTLTSTPIPTPSPTLSPTPTPLPPTNSPLH